MLRLVEAPDQQQSAHLKIPGVCRVQPVATCLECGARGLEGLRRKAQIARHQRDFGLGDDAPRTGHDLPRTETACRAAQQQLCPVEIAKLRHRNATERQCGRILAQRDLVQRAERITYGQCASRRRDQRIHRNPAKFVTPTPRCRNANLAHATGRKEWDTHDHRNNAHA